VYRLSPILTLFSVAGCATVETDKPIPPRQAAEGEAINRSERPLLADPSFENELWAIRTEADWTIDRTIHVDCANPRASDENNGSLAQPVRTVQRGIDLAEAGTRVLIHPGIYRETVRLPAGKSGAETRPLVIEASQKGKAVISGADVWENWKPEGDPGLYSHEWPQKWGTPEIPEKWRDWWSKTVKEDAPISRRREIVVVDGRLLRQELSAAELEDNAFFADEHECRIYIRLPKDKEPAESLVEVAVRSMGFGYDVADQSPGPSCYVVRGLVIRHVAGPAELPQRGFICEHEGGVFRGSKYLIEDCEFLWNNWGGAGIKGEDAVVRRCSFSDNGSKGMAGNVKRALFEDNESSRNNWRMSRVGFRGWIVCAMKFMVSKNVVVRRHRSIDNETSGMWFDWDNKNVLIEDCALHGNGPFGLYIEANSGPFTVRNCEISGNYRGIMIANSEDVTIEGSQLLDNETGILISPRKTRKVKNRDLRVQRLTMRGNTIAASNGERHLLNFSDYPFVIQTLIAERNAYAGPLDQAFTIGPDRIGFAEWQARSGQDSDSRFSRRPGAKTDDNSSRP
jgi:parallel beta-helix repeat protein